MKKYKFHILAVILYFIVCYILYHMQYKMYGDAINTMFIIFMAICPILVFAEYSAKPIDDPDEEKRLMKKQAKSQKISKILEPFTFIIILVTVLSGDKGEFYTFIMFFFVFFFISNIILFIVNKKLPDWQDKFPQPLIISFIFLFLITVSLLYNVVINPFTINEAEHILSQNGYIETKYNGVAEKDYYRFIEENNASDIIVMVNDLEEYEDALKFYQFEGIKDGEKQVVNLSVKTGRIISYYVLE